jgi:UDP-glucose 4-epimerase
MSKILVTGGSGFIGSHVVDAYILAGHEVAIVDNVPTGFQENVNPKATLFEGDIRNKEFIASIIQKFSPEIINHHAAQISVEKSVSDPFLDNEVNVIGTLNLLSALENNDYVKKFIFASSGGAVYGAQDHPSNEATCPSPISPYGISKLACEKYISVYSQLFGFKAQILRYSNVFGPRQSVLGEAGVITIFIDQMSKGTQPIIYGDGTNTRDFVFVDDVVRANLAALQSDREGVWNISSNTETSINEVFDSIAKILGSKVKKTYAPARDGDVKRSCLNNSKAAAELKWKPQVSFMDGLEKMARKS